MNILDLLKGLWNFIKPLFTAIGNFFRSCFNFIIDNSLIIFIICFILLIIILFLNFLNDIKFYKINSEIIKYKAKINSYEEDPEDVVEWGDDFE